MALNLQLLDDVGRTFDWQPDPAQYFPTPATELVRAGLRRSLEAGSGVLVLTGGAGAGKTLLLQVCLQDLAGRWAHLGHLSYTSMNGADILRSVAYAFGMPSGDQPDHISPMAWTENQLRTWTALGEASLLVVDEAQNLPADALQPLLALSQLRHDGRPLLRMVLVGRPPLLELLTSPDLRAWATAIGAQFSLPALKPAESSAYLAARLGNLTEPGRSAFSPQVLAAIHARTQGRPGQINVLCKQLLQMAILSEENVPVDVDGVHAQADELGFHPEASVLDVPIASVVSARVMGSEAPQPAFPAPSDAGLPTVLPALRPAAQPRPLAPAKPPTKPLASTPMPTPAGYKHRLLPLLALLLVAGTAAALYLRPSAPVREARQPNETTRKPTTAVAAPTTIDPSVSAAKNPEPSNDPSGPAPSALPATAPLTAAESMDVVPTVLPAAMPSVAPAALPADAAITSKPSPRSTPPAPRLPATTPAPAAAGPVLASKNHNPVCAPLLAQLSLGEPLTKRQQHTLESTCR